MLTQIGLDTPNLAQINFFVLRIFRGGTSKKTPYILEPLNLIFKILSNSAFGNMLRDASSFNYCQKHILFTKVKEKTQLWKLSEGAHPVGKLFDLWQLLVPHQMISVIAVWVSVMITKYIPRLGTQITERDMVQVHCTAMYLTRGIPFCLLYVTTHSPDSDANGPRLTIT